MSNSKESKARIISSLFYNYDKVGHHPIFVYEGENSFVINIIPSFILNGSSVFLFGSDIDKSLELYEKKEYRKLKKKLRKEVKNFILLRSHALNRKAFTSKDNYFLYIIRK